MRLVMTGKINRHRAAAEGREFVLDDAWQPEFLVQPIGDGGGKGTEATRRDSEGRREDALKFQQRLFVVNHGIERSLRLLEAPSRGMAGKGGVVLDSGKAFLLGGRDNEAVLE